MAIAITLVRLFYTRAVARNAIQEVILPFVAEHPYYLDYLQGKDKGDTNN